LTPGEIDEKELITYVFSVMKSTFQAVSAPVTFIGWKWWKGKNGRKDKRS